jgi:hypothetical protein
MPIVLPHLAMKKMKSETKPLSCRTESDVKQSISSNAGAPSNPGAGRKGAISALETPAPANPARCRDSVDKADSASAGSRSPATQMIRPAAPHAAGPAPADKIARVPPVVPGREPAAGPPPPPAGGFGVFHPERILHLIGSFREGDVKKVRVPGATEIHLNGRQFLVLLVLACFARHAAGLGAPVAVPAIVFPGAKDLMAGIELARRTRARTLLAFSQNAEGEETVRKIIKQLRNLFSMHPAYADLLDNGPGRRGYQLPIPGHNVWIEIASETEAP